MTVRNDNPVVIDPEEDESDIVDLIDLVIGDDIYAPDDPALDFWRDNDYP